MGEGEIAWRGIAALQSAFESGELSALEVADAFLRRIEALDPELQAYSVVWPERARHRAERLDAEGGGAGLRPPLFGVPVALKDLCDVQGEPTRAGTTALGAMPAAANAEVVDRLEAAGAVILGKTKMTEGAFVTHHPSVVPPVNPWNPNRWTGISSSGSGVAVAAGLCSAALGTDTGGSIRFPSAACGLTGLKPSHGRISLRGVFPLSESLDHIGPMGHSVDDVARLFAVLAGHDPGDPWSLAANPAVATTSALAPHVRGVRLGVDRAYCSEGIEASIAAAVEDAIRVLRDLGAEIVEFEMPPLDEAIAAWISLAAAEVAAAHAETYPARAEEYGEELRGAIDLGRGIDGCSVAQAWKARIGFSRRLEGLFDSVDALVVPVIPDLFGAPTNLGDLDANPAAGIAVRLTAPFNLSGVPSLTLPGGLDREGAPIGFQLVGPQREESRLLALGSAFQSATDWHLRHPPLASVAGAGTPPA